MLRSGTLDRPEEVAPDVHIFTRSKRPWFELSAGVPAFETFYVRYTGEEACEHMARTGRRGPWHATKGQFPFARGGPRLAGSIQRGRARSSPRAFAGRTSLTGMA